MTADEFTRIDYLHYFAWKIKKEVDAFKEHVSVSKDFLFPNITTALLVEKHLHELPFADRQYVLSYVSKLYDNFGNDNGW